VLRERASRIVSWDDLSPHVSCAYGSPSRPEGCQPSPTLRGLSEVSVGLPVVLLSINKLKISPYFLLDRPASRTHVLCQKLTTDSRGYS